MCGKTVLNYRVFIAAFLEYALANAGDPIGRGMIDNTCALCYNQLNHRTTKGKRKEKI